MQANPSLTSCKSRPQADVFAPKPSSPSDSGPVDSGVRTPVSRGVSGALSDRLDIRASGHGRAAQKAVKGQQPFAEELA